MADILDYTQNTGALGVDALYLVDDATGTPADNYILFSDFNDSIRDNIDRIVQILLVDSNSALTTGNDWAYGRFTVPSQMNGYNLTDAQVSLAVASTSGNPTFQVYNFTDSVDMLTTAIKCDTGELNSYTASTGSVVDTNNDDVATGDQIQFDCDDDGSAAVKGATIILTFAKP